MTFSRWWSLAVVGTPAVLIAIVALQSPPAWQLIGTVVTSAVLVAGWFALGWRAARYGGEPRAVAVSFVIVLVLVSGTATAFYPTMATLQSVIYPLVWCLLPRLRDTIVASTAVALTTGVGLYLSGGADWYGLVQAVIIECLSFTFALALGTWITRSTRYMATLSHHTGALDERERLAREIHDTIAQDLTGIVLTAQRGLRELRAGNSREAEAQLEILEANAREALAESRALVTSGSASTPLGGLAAALHRLAERFERETGIAVIVSADDLVVLDRDREVVLLRCAQEGLANVRKHSSATTARITMTMRAGVVDLVISDDGAGFDPLAPSVGSGLIGLRERLALAEGTLTVSTAPGTGTTLLATVRPVGILP